MSEETRRALDEALAKLAEATKLTDELKQRTLDEIALGIPDRVDALARGAAQREPHITKSLGKDGVAGFRDELARVSSKVAADVRRASGGVKWPEESRDLAKNRAVQSALFEFLYPMRVNEIAAVFRRFGYDVMEGARSSQSLVLPQFLYDEKVLAPLAEALVKRASIVAAVARAKAADDRDIVDDLWGDGPSAARLPGTPSREW